jgi:DDE superfamily endonuclease
MRYETIEHLKATDFKRLTGVQRETFEEMRKAVEKGLRDFGRPPKLSRADQLLMTLMYWREYRTEFHIAQSYGVSEATVCRTIRKVEEVLVRSKKFGLPGKKALQPSDTVFEVILVDASEQPIERPKKARKSTIVAKRGAILKRRS